MNGREEWVLSCDARMVPPPSVEETTWQVLCLLSGRRWSVGARVVRVLLGADEDRDGAVADWARRCGLLRTVEEDAERSKWYADARAAGWAASADLVALFKNYPTVDYHDGENVARLSTPSMKRWNDLWVVPDRFRGRDLIGAVDARLADAFGRPQSRGPLTAAELDTIAAAAVGVTGTARRGGSDVAVGVRPSFAALRSVQAFVLVDGAEGLDRGAYRVDDEGMVRLTGAPLDRSDDEKWQHLVPGIRRAGFIASATLLLALRWDRLRARYRDPLAFRSAFIEVGHAVAAADLLARSWGLRTYAHGGLDDPGLEAGLNLATSPEDLAVVFALTMGTQGA